jgi:hypothetical protein|tara:strand:+ start:870 stop:986 length:117 start_codon:yes stop_codon:yes gene_type:complete
MSTTIIFNKIKGLGHGLQKASEGLGASGTQRKVLKDEA